jgi:hypothetical protein
MDIETAAQLMGMKPHREVREIVAVDGGHKVLTHDGRWTLITDDGEIAGDVPAPELVDQVDCPDEVTTEDVVDELAPAEGVPDGTKDEILGWVGDDPARAAAALEAERSRENPRSTLVAALEKVAG